MSEYGGATQSTGKIISIKLAYSSRLLTMLGIQCAIGADSAFDVQ